jgi:hypothetical protein
VLSLLEGTGGGSPLFSVRITRDSARPTGDYLE